MVPTCKACGWFCRRFACGMPPVGLLGELWGLGQKFLGGDVTSSDYQRGGKGSRRSCGNCVGLIAARKKTSLPQRKSTPFARVLRRRLKQWA